MVQHAYDELALFVKKKFSIEQFRSDYVPGAFYTILRKFLYAAGPADAKVGADIPAVVTETAWKPEVRPEDLESQEEQAHASEVLLRAQRCDMGVFPAVLEEACRAAYDASASFVQKKFAMPEFRSQYVRSEFYNVLEHFLETPGPSSRNTERLASLESEQGAFQFQPRVSIEVLPNATDRLEASQVFAKVRREHVSRIEERLSELFAQEIAARMPLASEQLREEMWDSWMPVHYFDVVKAVTTQEKRRPDSAPSLDMFTSPRRRIRRTSRVDTTGAVEFRSVEALH